jgi:hypothetical protein
MKLQLGCLALAYLSMVSSISAQTQTAGGSVAATTAATQSAAQSAAAASQVPRLVRFSGTAQNVNPDEAASAVATRDSASVPSGVVGMTFSLYSDQTGGAPLWSEVQNVTVDKAGHYTVQLGSTQAEGLPVELFSSAQAQWLGVRQEGQAEQPRIMLLSVPYALKAADAETFGGKPPSAFVSAPTSATAAAGSGTTPGANGKQPAPPSVGGSGTADYLAIWDTGSTLGSSSIFESNGNIGIGTTSPSYPLEITATNSVAAVYVTQGNSAAIGVYGASSSGIGVEGRASGATGSGIGVEGVTYNTNGFGVLGAAEASTGGTYGVVGRSLSPSGTGVHGRVSSTTGETYGVSGTSDSADGVGVYGLADSTTGSSTGVYASNTSTGGFGLFAINTATTGDTTGIAGTVKSPTGTGIYGDNEATTGASLGIEAATSSEDGGIAMLGIGVQRSGEGATVTLRPIGVWGDTNVDSGVGVLATADFGIAFAGYNDAENISTAKLENDETTDITGNILATHSPHFGGICEIDVGGDLACNGSKSAVVPVDGGTRKVALYAIEAPENWFEDAGSGQLSNGAAIVRLESTFAQTVNSEVEYHVFLTPNGDCKGLYVTNKTADSFEVRELGGGKATVGFDYRIMARRKNYETIRLADKTKQFDRIANEPRPAPGKVAQPRVPKPPAFATRAGVVPSKQ